MKLVIIVEQMDQILKVVSIFSSIAISLTTILAFLSAFFKPIRNFIVWLYKKFVGNRDKGEEMLKKIDEVQQSLSKEVAGVKDELTSKIQEVSISNDKNEMKRLRWEILDFANSCKYKRKHTRDEFKHIIEIHDDYEELIEKTGSKNGFLEAEYSYILDVYAERQEKNDFL